MLPKNRWDVGVNMKGIGGGPQTSPEPTYDEAAKGLSREGNSTQMKL